MEENRNNINAAGESRDEREETCKAVADGIAKLFNDVKPKVSLVLMQLESGDMVITPLGSPFRLMMTIAAAMQRNETVRLLIDGASDMLKDMKQRDGDKEH